MKEGDALYILSDEEKRIIGKLIENRRYYKNKEKLLENDKSFLLTNFIKNENLIPNDLCGMNWSRAASFYGLKVYDYRKMSDIDKEGSKSESIMLSRDEMSTIYNVVKPHIFKNRPVIIWVQDDDEIYANHFLLIVGYAKTSDGDMLLYVQNTASTSYADLINVLKIWEYVVQFDILYRG